MYYKGLFKRIVPFFLTFVAGLFIASFFVTVTTPNFSGFRRGSNKHREIQRLRTENQELKRNACELRKQNEELRRNASETVMTTVDEFPFEVDAPPPPPPPRKAPRHPRFDK
jgi:hypothetical protein